MENQQNRETLQNQLGVFYKTKNQEICNRFLQKLRQIEGFTLSPNAYVTALSGNCATIAVLDTEKNKKYFASEITLYSKSTSFGSTSNKIGYGSTGAFSIDNIGSYWRTIHAGECLKHWDDVCEIVNKTCQEYADFCELLEDLQNSEIDSEASEKALLFDDLLRLDRQVEAMMFPEPYDD